MPDPARIEATGRGSVIGFAALLACLASAGPGTARAEWSAVAAGDSHTCALMTGGSVHCWGSNGDGQIGDGTTTNSSVPVAATGLASSVAAIAAGSRHTCALPIGAGLECWGYNQHGQLGNSTTTNSSIPVAVSSLPSGVAVIAAGDYHTCVLGTDGGVRCSGLNSSGQLGNSTTTNSSVPLAVTGLSSGVAAIAAGGFHSCALGTGGGVQCWGLNEDGQLGNGTTTDSSVPVAVTGWSSGVAAIAAGDYHTCALSTGGGVQCWGFNYSGQLGNDTTTNSSIPVAVTGLSSGIAVIAAGDYHTCALSTDGGVQCWGLNGSGQLGNGTTANSSVPVSVTGLSSGVAAIAAGGFHTCAVTTGGAVRCWGNNLAGQLGDGTTANSSVPVAVSVSVPALGARGFWALVALLALLGTGTLRPGREPRSRVL